MLLGKTKELIEGLRIFAQRNNQQRKMLAELHRNAHKHQPYIWRMKIRKYAE